jgi:hypothetical protein
MASAEWTGLWWQTVSGMVATVLGGWILNRLEQRRSKLPEAPPREQLLALSPQGTASEPVPLSTTWHDLFEQAARVAPLGFGVPYMLWAAQCWNLSPLELPLAVLVTAAACVLAMWLRDSATSHWSWLGRCRANLVCLCLVVAAITLANRWLREQLTVSLSGSIDAQEVVTGELTGEPHAAVFLLVRSTDATGDTKYMATQLDSGGRWAVTASFDGPSRTHFVVRAVALDPYALSILGDPSPIPAERIDELATIRSRAFVIVKK